MSACTQNAPNLRCCFLKRRPTNTPRGHRLANGQLSSFYAPSPSFSSFGAASVMLYCSAPPASSSTPLRPSVYYWSFGLVVNVVYIRTLCDYINVVYIFYPACIVLKLGWSSTARMPRLVVSPPSLSPSHPPMSPPSRCQLSSLYTPLAMVRLVWRRLCEAVMSSSFLIRQKHPFLLSGLCLTYARDIKKAALR